MSRVAILALAAYTLISLPMASFAGDIDGIRGPISLTADHAVLPPPKETLTDEREPRSSYGSPPVIPHSIFGYRLDGNKNDCLSCHGRALTPDTPGAPISVTHFVDRNGKVLASLAPDRYFCTQCHLTQTEASPPIGNDYQVFAAPLRRYVCIECHLPQPEDVPFGATAPHGGAGWTR